MRVVFLLKFKKAFARLPTHVQQKTLERVRLLANDLRHPGVKAKKMTSVGDIWEGRVDDKYRFTFKIQGDNIIVRRVGAHDILKQP